MRCEKCNAEFANGLMFCPECGAPTSKEEPKKDNSNRNIEGFENTVAVKKELKHITALHGDGIIRNKEKFIALLNDYIPEYEKERRLLRTMLKAGVLEDMLGEVNQQIAITKAEQFIVEDMFLSKNAAEFVVSCFAHLLNWDYEATMYEAEKKVTEEEKKKAQQMMIDSRVFSRAMASKYRFRLIGKNVVVIPDGYTKVDGFCFDGFKNIRSVELPDSMIAIGEYAFSNCKSLRVIEFPASIRLIKQGAFNHCEELTMLKIPDGILEIEDVTFQFCRSLEIIDIPPTVSSIGAMAFAGCESLRKLFLPDSIKFIDENAFAHCDALTIRCYENSYVHKYCLANNIKVETVSRGLFFKP
ncbi:MAG: leucine-rich repeat protein [Ruminococcus sp.]|nr:leucine-rich repeat protein [Ruminococcus sp.]